MKKQVLFFLVAGLTAFGAHASNVAVVDSGTDFNHVMLKSHAWVNPNETAGNKVDDDGNGKVDDVNGWNFIDGYSRVFFPEQLKSINPIVYPLIRVIAHQQAGTMTKDELAFYKKNVTDLTPEQKAALVAHINYFGEYVHSTHVSGIIVQENPLAKIMSARVFPDEPPPLYNTPSSARFHEQGVVDWLYHLLAIVTNGTFNTVGTYLHETHMDVANYSLGMSLTMIAKESLILRGTKNPTPDQIAKETQRLYKQFEIEGKKWMAASPDTLFVVAAGNDGTDNDVLPSFPSNLRVPNEISVAATQAYEKLAFFSNYGATTVDVAAPGVAILSTVPSLDEKAMLPLSGTSMAAPFVTGVASRVKDANPALKPAQIRQILMQTVDYKEWLKGKVVSGGIVNPDRAAMAADLSRTMDLDQAIAQARTKVADCARGAHGPQMRPTLLGEQAPQSLKEMAKQLVF